MRLVLTLWMLLLPWPLPGAGPVDYLKEIKPVLAARCYACHGALKQNAGLRLDTAASVRQGGKHGPVIVARKPAASRLLEKVGAHEESERMPPEGEPLKPEQIARLRDWIAQGARAPADEQPELDPRSHWAFQPPRRPALPKSVGSRTLAANPVDAFISAELSARGLRPQPPAEKSLWLRRVYLGLIGLPPTLAELQAFELDHSPRAHEVVVDRLLASPHYGERWGRHFMDIWRYTDWYGLGAQLRNSQKHIWHWRDWIVESLNAGKGYDRMIVEMLAADEQAPLDQEALRATGFLARNYYLFNRTTWLDDVIEHTSKAFLGLTMNCVKCHDHKFDPLSHKDYYALRAVFEPYHVRLDEVAGEPDLEKDGLPRAFDLHLDRPTYIHLKGDEKTPDATRPIAPAVPAVLGFRPFAVQAVALPVLAHEPGLRPHVLENHLQAAERRIAAAKAALAKARPAAAAGQSTGTNQPPLSVRMAETALAAAELHPPALRAAWAADQARSANSPNTEVTALLKTAGATEARYQLARAEAEVAKAEMEIPAAATGKQADAEKKSKAARDALDKARKTAAAPGQSFTSLRGSLKALEGPDEKEATRTHRYPATSTGRRTALAQWIADRQNPLTARVLVNHVWLRHLGQPLVATPDDFGRRSPAPAHQALLDWLSIEFMENGWNLKHLHRLLVLSDTYRRSSTAAGATAATLTRDAENKFCWRMNPLRMESQVVRDSLLHLAGTLDLKLGGPTIDPSREDVALRRSLYFTQSRDEVHKFLDMFDDANILECYRRAESILPQQALALANSKLAATAAAQLAGRIGREAGSASDESFVQTAFTTILAVRPTAAEVQLCEASLEKLRAALVARRHPRPDLRAREELVQALLNHNDFVVIR